MLFRSSGRALISLRQVADPADGVLLAGSHGIEVQLDSADIDLNLVNAEVEQLETLGRVLARISGPVPGTWIEKKPAGLALHTRLASSGDGLAVQREAKGQVEELLPGLTIREGKNVLEFSVRSSTKGDALELLRAHTGAETVFYAGDDVTDEDAFAVLSPDDVGLKIGPGASGAQYRVRGPEEVAQVLALLADFRASAEANGELADQSEE